MKPNMIKKWSIALLVAAGAAGLTGCEGMRVDEGASESDHSGIVADRAITGQLSGVVVDEHGRALEGATISAYGLSTTSKVNGTWTLSNVPITNLVISNVYDNGSSTTLPTDQDADENSPMVAKGKIYTTFSMKDHATFHSTYEGAIAVITHSGDESGANSIVVSEISATIPYVELSKMDRTFVGNVYDLGESNFAFQKSAPSSVQLRLLPNYVDDNLYGFDGTDNNTQNLGGNEVESAEFSPGYYGVDPVTVALDNGSFTISGAGALRSGYELRVDGTSYRPAQYPEWNTGLQQTLIYVYDANNQPLIDVQNQLPNNGTTGAIAAGGGDNISEGAYWKIEKLNIATGTNSLVTDFGNLYVENFEAQDNADPTVALFSYYGGPDNLDTGGNQTYENDNITIDSDVATALGTTQPLVVVFDQDMRSIDGNIITTAPNAVRLYDDKLTLVDISSATLDGRTLTITTTAAMSTGFYRLVLKRDRFVDKNGERLAASNPFGAGNEIAIGDDRLGQEDYFDSIYGINYGTSAYSLASVSNLVQNADDSLAKTTAPRIFIEAGTSSATEEVRLDRLREAVKHVIVDDTSGALDNLSFTEFDDDDNVTFSQASVNFVAGAGNYKFAVTNGAGVAISSSTTVTGTGTIALTTGVLSGGFTDSEATFNVASPGTVTVTVDNASVGYTVGVTPLGELATTDSGQTVNVTLVDQTHPRVALQFSSDNGQDNGTVAVFNYSSTDETGETVYDGQSRLLYPKLNLTASLYDKFGYRSRTEVSDTNTTGSTALSDDLNTNSRNTPLLATTAATVDNPGTTESGLNNNVYTPADYTAWITQTISSGTATCTYYVADAGLDVTWYKSDSTGVIVTPFDTVADTDEDNSTTEGFAALSPALTVAAHTAATAGANVGQPMVKSPSNCGVAGTPVLGSPVRTIVIETTEDVDNITYDATFQAVEGAILDNGSTNVVRTNVIAGSDLATEITGLTNAAAGENHILLTLNDWRNVDESPRWQDGTSQTDVANSIDEGLSLNSLLQLVGVKDLNGNTAVADHAVGVLIADATPALATDAAGTDGSGTSTDTIAVTFDQQLNSTGTLTSVTVDDNGTQTTAHSVRTAVGAAIAYVDPFGSSQTITVTGAASGATLSITGGDFGYVPSFNGASQDIRYASLQDNNYNSWDVLANTSDQYDDSGAPTLRDVVDVFPPRLRYRAADYTNIARDNSSVFLAAVSAPATLSGAHATQNQDNDTTYTAGVDLDASAASGFMNIAAGGGAEEDMRLYNIWNSTAQRMPDNNSGPTDYDRVVLTFTGSDNISVSGGAFAYYYRPEVDNITNANIYDNITNAARGNIIDAIQATDGVNDNASIAVDEVDGNKLVFLFPDIQSWTFDAGESMTSHRLVLDNVSINGTPYVISIAPPTGTALIGTSGTDDAASTDDVTAQAINVTYYRKVWLQLSDNVSVIQTADVVSAERDNNTTLAFMEDLASTTAVTAFDRGVNYFDDATDTDTVLDQTTTSDITLFTHTASVTDNTTTINHVTNFGESPTTNELIGHDAHFTLTAVDEAGNSSTVKITRRRGHGYSSVNGGTVITNQIGGTALGLD